MKNRMKKKIALFISMVMVLTLVVVPGDVKAATPIEINTTITIDSEDGNSYNINSGGELIIGAGGNVTGDIVIYAGGKLTVNAGGSASSVKLNSDTEYSKNVYNYGTINNIVAGNSHVYNYETGTIGYIDMPSPGYTYLTNEGRINGFSDNDFYTDLENYASGIIGGAVNIETNSDIDNSGSIESINVINASSFKNNGTINTLTLSGTDVENSGNIESLTAISGSTVVNNEGASIGTLNVTFSPVENNGTIENLSYNSSSGSCNLSLGGSSNTKTLNLPAIDGGGLIKISATTGAAIDVADVYVDSLDSASTGPILVNNSFKLSGTSTLPSGFGISVNNSTTITTEVAYSNMIVSCNGDKYLLPNQILAGNTIANMYDYNVDATQIDIPELEVGYGATDIGDSAKTLNISNSGIADMKCKITSIPDFVELYNGDEVLAADSTLSISSDAAKTITIKLKAGMPVAEYSDDIVLEKWTAFDPGTGLDDVNTGSVSIPVTAEVIRKEGEGTVTVDDIYYGEEIVPVVVSATNGTTAVTYKYKVKGAADSTYTATAPTAAGEYTIQATFAQTDEYKEVTATADFAILRKTGTATVTVDDIYYGEEITPIVVSATNGITAVTYKYKAKNAPDTAFTATVPTAAGEYTIQAIFAQTDEYNEVTATADFAILRKTGTATVTVADVYYGETIVPMVTSTNGTENVTYKYKAKNAPDTAFTATVPTAVGEYTIQATFAQTEIYKEVVATADFKIVKANGTATVTVAEVYYGKTPSPVVSSSTNGTASVTYLYKVKNAADSTYTAAVPTAVGEYTIKASFAATENYKEVTATADFKISYLPAPENAYSISGKQGKNDYYTSEVTIIPAQGYLIADKLDGTYKESVTISKSSDGFNVYLKNAATGEKTAAVAVKAIKIDTKAPIILNAVGGDKLYGDQIEIKVQDDNLAEVLVNGEKMKIEDGTATLKLSSNNGEETYKISCSDAAGNVSEMELVVAADWMKNKTIPVGTLVRLIKEYSYNLGAGTWQVKGDETSYSGNITFYVNKDGEYSFSKID